MKLIKELASLYFATFGKQMKLGCGACYHKSYLELKTELNHTTMEEKECSFKLNVSNIRAFGSNASYNNDTLTDEVAIKYLKQNINRLSQFSEYPSNYLELIEGKKSEKKVILEDNKDEAKEVKVTKKRASKKTK